MAGVRLDVCAFVGVAPRGPAWVPRRDQLWREDQPTVGGGRRRQRSVALSVGSFAEYRELYGGYEGPGRLPYAVRAFFDNGGRRAVIVRVTPPMSFDAAGDPRSVARAAVGGLAVAGTGDDVRLFARSEGSWGDGLRVGFGCTSEPLGALSHDTDRAVFAEGEAPPLGSLLRLRMASGASELRFIASLSPVGGSLGGQLEARFHSPASAVAEELELVFGELWLDDGEGRTELHAELGLSPDHPRWLATVLCHESALAWPDGAWVATELEPELDAHGGLVALDRETSAAFDQGEDRYADIAIEHFFDPDFDPRADEPGAGVMAVAETPEVASVVAPDLYHPASLVLDPGDAEPMDERSSGDWEPCEHTRAAVEPTTSEDPTLPGLIRDPQRAVELAEIVAAQAQLVAAAELLDCVALLDVPPALGQREILAWRQNFASSWAAAYHPWLRLVQASDEPARESPVRLGPAAAAAGIIAARELAHGVPHGPANALALGVVDVEDRVSPRRHDQLHPRAINVLLREREGVRLSAARTLASDPKLRQLSVRRLMMLLRRSLLRELQWAVFEPNDRQLRARLRDVVRSFLRGLYRQGAFRGASEDQAFFVRCDAGNNPRVLGDRGEVLVELGVAPAEPIEFIVLAVTRDGDGGLEVGPA